MPLKRKPIHFCARCCRRVIRLGNGALRHCNGGGYKKPPVCIGATLRKKRVAKHATAPVVDIVPVDNTAGLSE